MIQSISKPIEKEKSWLKLTKQLSQEFAERATHYDRNDQFVNENYEELKRNHFFSALIPEESGGEGVSFDTMCRILKIISQSCSSTALALSMHQHLIAANVWKYTHGKGGDQMLKKVARENLILVSTGARDWLESNGELEKVEGGYLFSAQKHFASQASIGDIMVTSGRFADEKGKHVYHFPVPVQSDGVEVLDNWYTLGMRGTGSHSIILRDVFIPEESIVLKRPAGKYHPFWNVVLTVALPLIMSVYLGIAEKAGEIAINKVRKSGLSGSGVVNLVGELNNLLETARITWRDMIRLTNNFDFEPDQSIGHKMLTRKTLAAKACVEVVHKSMELTGGQSYFRSMELERLFRDVQAGIYHPLPEKQQQEFAARYLVDGSFD